MPEPSPLLSKSGAPAESLRAAVRPTTFVMSALLDKKAGTRVVIASETFQHTGSFKFRAAYNVALNTEADTLIAASSGNFGQALALSAQMRGKKAIIVMPTTSAKVKVEQVRNYGARVELVDTTKVSRAQRVAELAAEYPHARVVSAYDDADVIAGNSSLAEDLLSCSVPLDLIVAPVGGGGLTAGIITGLARNGSQIAVIGAEPQLGNDACQSLHQGQIVANANEPETLADGARTLSLGKSNWEILRSGLSSIVEVSEAGIASAVATLFHLANLKCEPTGALSVGAVLEHKQIFAGKTVCCVVSGGNVDAELYCRLISQSD